MKTSNIGKPRPVIVPAPTERMSKNELCPESTAEIEQTPEPTPGYKGIVVNPPWGNLSAGDIQRLPVGDLAAPDCILWLRCDSAHLADAVEAIKNWGFRYATKLTYMKEACNKDMMTESTEEWLGAARGNLEIELSTPGYLCADDPIATISHVAASDLPIRSRRLIMFVDANVEEWESWSTDQVLRLSQKWLNRSLPCWQQ